jgi:hypothetical protein
MQRRVTTRRRKTTKRKPNKEPAAARSRHASVDHLKEQLDFAAHPES